MSVHSTLKRLRFNTEPHSDKHVVRQALELSYFNRFTYVYFIIGENPSAYFLAHTRGLILLFHRPCVWSNAYGYILGLPSSVKHAILDLLPTLTPIQIRHSKEDQGETRHFL